MILCVRRREIEIQKPNGIEYNRYLLERDRKRMKEGENGREREEGEKSERREGEKEGNIIFYLKVLAINKCMY